MNIQVKPGHTMNKAQVIECLRMLLVTANASDCDNPPELGGNDLPASAASGRDGLYAYAQEALISLGQGASCAYYVETGEWIDSEHMTPEQVEAADRWVGVRNEARPITFP